MRLALALATNTISGISSGGGAPSASLQISWTDNSELEDGFRIEKSLDGVDYTTAGTVAPDVEQFTITGLAFNTLYYVRVYAFNEEGDSEVLGPVELYTAPPEAPTDFQISSTTATSATAAWTLPAIEPVTGYRVYYRLTGAPIWSEEDVADGETGVVISGLTESEEYEFYVVGYNENGAQPDSETEPSSTVEATTRTVLETATINSDGDELTLVFSGAVSFGAGGNGGWLLEMTGGAATLAYSSGAGTNTLVYGISRTVYVGETGTISYTQPGNGLEDTLARDIANITDDSVTNNSSQADYLLSDDFDYADAAAAAAGGWVDAGTPVWGSNKLTLDSSTDASVHSFTPSGEVWVYAPLTQSALNSAQCLYLYDASNNILAEYRIRVTGAVRITHGTVLATSAGTPALAATEQGIWWRYKKGTGANGEIDAYLGTSTTRGSILVSITTGDATADAAKIGSGPHGWPMTMEFSRVRVSATEIGDSPA